MGDAIRAVGGHRPVMSDLVEYLIVRGADEASLGEVALAVERLVDEGVMRVLDLVVLVRDDDGGVVVRELEEIVRLDLPGAAGSIGGVLSHHDVMLASTAVRRGSAAIVLVVEDLWAAPLSAAARQADGEIVAGERLASWRADEALARPGCTRVHRDRNTDVLARPPGGAHLPARGWAELVVDPVEQLKELADLRGRGLLSDDELERLKERLVPGRPEA